jgi:hypothetical protein
MRLPYCVNVHGSQMSEAAWNPGPRSVHVELYTAAAFICRLSLHKMRFPKALYVQRRASNDFLSYVTGRQLLQSNVML